MTDIMHTSRNHFFSGSNTVRQSNGNGKRRHGIGASLPAIGMALTLACVPLCVSAGKIKCWTNAEGIRECGNHVPAEFSQKRVEVMNEQGVVVEVQAAAKTKEQAARDAERARLQKVEDEKNQLLLRAYTTERDLLIARDNKVAAIQGIIDLTSSNNTSLQESLVALEGRAANYERSGKSAPEALMHEMESTQRQIRNNERYITAKQKEMERITASYNNDLERFRKLKNRNYKRKIAQEAQAETKTKK